MADDGGRHVAREVILAQRKRIAELEAAMTSLRLTACILLQHAEGCAVNHYGDDFQLHGEPGWLRDCRLSIEVAEATLQKSTN